MDALSSEWRSGVRYAKGDRVAFKIGDTIGAAAFECIRQHISNYGNQPVAMGNEFWEHYPRGFPRAAPAPTTVNQRTVTGAT
ncbi:hypothetical protein CC2G_011843 [Coprinopsis cinerea AmutBmut pab1-1]|nr:hypothetical protein CC2G_011843 [Coprinopsis cinerea AmutBmut pab1-1]